MLPFCFGLQQYYDNFIVSNINSVFSFVLLRIIASIFLLGKLDVELIVVISAQNSNRKSRVTKQTPRTKFVNSLCNCAI